MKCVSCGTELESGCLFCSKCGKEVQIVPDYNEFDDDYIHGLVGSTDEEDELLAKQKKEEARKQKELKRQEEKKARNRKIIVASVIAAIVIVILIIIVTIVGINNRNYNSVDYQIGKAKEALAEKDYQKAIGFYDRALILDADNIDIMLSLADIYIQLNDEDSALAFYNQILDRDINDVHAIEGTIDILDKRADYDSIIELSEKVDSDVFDKYFSVYIAKDPVFGIKGGTFTGEIELTISSEDDDVIYYTIDGQNPKDYGTEYKIPIVLGEEGDYDIQAVCVNKYGLYSSVIGQKYKIEYEKPKMPVVSPNGGSYISETYVTIIVPKGCTAYYDWNSTEPSISSTKYTKPILIPEGNNVLSVIIIDNKTKKCSDIYRGHFEYYSEE